MKPVVGDVLNPGHDIVILFRNGFGRQDSALARDYRHKRESPEEQGVVDQKIGMIKDEDRHARQARHQHVDHVDKNHNDGPRQQLGLHETGRVTGRKGLLPDARQMLRHRQRDAYIEPLKERFRRAGLEHPEEADRQQADEHDQRERDDHDGLDCVGKGVGEFLNGKRNNQREEPDRDGVRDEDDEDLGFKADQEAEPGEFGPKACSRRQVVQSSSRHRAFSVKIIDRDHAVDLRTCQAAASRVMDGDGPRGAPCVIRPHEVDLTFRLSPDWKPLRAGVLTDRSNPGRAPAE